MFNNAFTITHKSATVDFDLLVFYHLTNRFRITSKLVFKAHGEMTWHAGIKGNMLQMKKYKEFNVKELH